MKKITLMLFMMMLSLCAHAQLPQEGFETWPVPGWATYQNGVGPNTWQSGAAGTALQGVANTNSAYIASQNVAPPGQPIDYLVTKPFTVPANAKLTWMSRFSLGGDQGNTVDVMIVKVADNATGDPTIANNNYVSLIDNNGWTESETNTQQQVWTEKELTIPNTYTNSQVYIAFVYKSVNNSSTERWLIDNVQVDVNCLTPTFTVTNPTTSSVRVNITANPSSAANFGVEIVPAGQNPDGVVDHTFSGTQFVVPGLDPNTEYKVYVWALCSPTNPSDVAAPIDTKTRPIGITCAEPIEINTTAYQITGNTQPYGDDIEGNPGTGCNAGNNYLNGNEVVFAYTPTTTGNVSIVMTNNGANSGMFVYASCAAVGNNCIAGGTGSTTTPVNIPSLAVTAGTTYYIVISTSTVQTTPFTLTIQPVSCAQPTNLSVDTATIGAQTANFSWQENGAATSWQVVTQPVGTGLPTDASDIETATTATDWPKTGLQQATAYEYYVRAVCGDGTFSAWSGPVTFTTTQIPAALPYSEDFEGAAHNFSLNNGTQTNKWFVGNAVNNGGARSLYVSNDNGTSNAYTITTTSTVQAYRDIAIPAGAQQINVTFDWRAMGQGTTVDYLRVWSVPTTYNPTAGILTNATNSGGGVQVGTYNLQNTWQTASVTLPATAFVAGQTRRLLFEWRNDGSTGTQPPGAIDNINVTVVTCPVPSAISLQTANPNDATLQWTAAPFNVSSYDYYYSTSNTPPTDTTPEMGNTSTTNATLTELDDSTTYYFWVRSDCGDANGNSFWVGPFMFMTPQIPAPLEFNDGFEGPVKWSLINGTQTNKWVVGNATANGGTQSLYISNTAGAANTNAYTITSTSTVHAYRDFAVPAGAGQVDIAFDWKAMGQTTVDYVRAWIVPVTYNPTAGTLITAATGANARTNITGTLNQKSNWTNFSYTWNNPAAGNYRLVFEWRNDGSGGTQPPAAIDNVNIKVVTCPKPTNLTATNPTQDSVVLNWTAGGTETQWEIYNVPAGSPFPTADTPGTPATQGVLNGLTANTPYDVYVRAVCSDTDKSRWVGPVNYRTECSIFPVPFVEGFNSGSTSEQCWTVLNLNGDADAWDMNYTSNPYEGDQSAVLYTDFNGTGPNSNNDWLITPQVQLTGNQRLRFRYRVQSASEPNRFEVLLSTTGKNPADFTQVLVPAANYSNIVYQQSTTVLANGGTGITGPVYIAFHVPGGGPDGWRLYIDQVIIENLPACPEITNLEANCVSATAASIDWTPGSTETSWEVAVLPSNAPIPTSGTTVTSPTFTAQGLTTGTAYTAYVRPICPNGEPGNWETVSFVTPETSILDAQPFCAATNGEFILFDNVDDSDNAQEYGDVACLGSTPNPVWYYLQVDQPGNLNFQIIQNTQFNAAGNPTGTGLDVDFVAWGPFTSTTEACQLIELVDCPTCPNNTTNANFYPFGNIIDCSYSVAAIENFRINNAQSGEIYVLLITNFNGQPGKIKLQQLNTSTGNTNCNILYSVELGPDKYLCGQNSTTLTATVTTPGNSQAPTYQWFRDGFAINPPVVGTTPLSQTVQVSDLGSHIYSVVVTVPNAANTEPITDQVTVVLGPDVTVPNPAGIAVCGVGGNASVDLAAMVSGILGTLNPAEYTVEFYPTLADATNGTTTPIDISQPFVTGTQTLYVRIESVVLPACFSTVPFPITVNDNASATISYGTAPYCIGGPDATVIFTGNAGGTYSAVPVSGTGTLVIDPVTGTVNVAGSTPGTYTVTYLIAANGTCPEFSTTATIEIIPQPVADFTYDDATYCQNAGPVTATLGTGAIAGTFTATPAGLDINPATGAINPQASTPGTYTVTNTIPAGNGCTEVTHSVTITINLAPVATFHYMPDSYCTNDGTATPILDGVSGTFSAEPAGLVIDAATGVVNLANSRPGTYVVTNAIVATPTCPAYGETASITVVAVPELAYIRGCQENNYTVTIIFDGDENYTEDNVDIVWTNSAGTTVGTDASLIVTQPGTYTATVTPIAGIACAVNIPVTVDDTTCLIQRGISPNGDGKNDNFDLSAFNVTKLSIFNRYGKEVYSYGNYTNQWHGQSSSGSELPTGTYFYMIERITGESATGWIYINREE